MIDDLKADLSWMRAGNLVDEGGIISPDAEQCLGPHCRANLGQQRQMDGLIECQASHRCRECRAVEDT